MTTHYNSNFIKAVRKMRNNAPTYWITDSNHGTVSDAIALVSCQRHNVGVILFILMLGEVPGVTEQGVSIFKILII